MPVRLCEQFKTFRSLQAYNHMVTGFIQNVVSQKFVVIGKFAIHKSIRGTLAFTELKFAWIMPSYVKNVPYSEVENIDFTSARKLSKNVMFQLIFWILPKGKPQPFQSKITLKSQLHRLYRTHAHLLRLYP